MGDYMREPGVTIWVDETRGKAAQRRWSVWSVCDDGVCELVTCQLSLSLFLFSTITAMPPSPVTSSSLCGQPGDCRNVQYSIDGQQRRGEGACHGSDLIT